VTELQRGKRKAARLFEFVAIALLALAVYGFKEAQSVFILAFPTILAYSAALRGLDAKWPSDGLQQPLPSPGEIGRSLVSIFRPQK